VLDDGRPVRVRSGDGVVVEVGGVEAGRMPRGDGPVVALVDGPVVEVWSGGRVLAVAV